MTLSSLAKAVIGVALLFTLLGVRLQCETAEARPSLADLQDQIDQLNEQFVDLQAQVIDLRELLCQVPEASTDPICGDCSGLPDGTACEDGDACTTNDMCILGICSGEDPTGLPCGSSVGECEEGVNTCLDGMLVCVGEVGPIAEVCDSLDNDCNGIPDDGGGCSCDPDGTYSVTSGPISYECCFGQVNVDVSSFVFADDGASIESSPSSPVTMTGAPTSCPSGSFDNSGTLFGSCNETYSLVGSFAGDDTWSGTYSLTFEGPDCDCFGGLGTPCENQDFPVDAVR